jgi:hypothetical protein
MENSMAICKICGIVCKPDLKGLCAFHTNNAKQLTLDYLLKGNYGLDNVKKEEFDFRKHY